MDNRKAFVFAIIAIFFSLIALGVSDSITSTGNNTTNINYYNNTSSFSGSTLSFYFHNDTAPTLPVSSKIMNRTLMVSSPLSSITYTNLHNGNTFIGNWTTDSLNLELIPSGIHELHLDARKVSTGGNRIIKIFFKCYAVASDGSNPLLHGTSELSNEVLAGTDTEIDTDFIAHDIDLNLTDRIHIEVWANQTGSGNLPNLIIDYNDATDSRLILPTTQQDITSFLNLKVNKSGDLWSGSMDAGNNSIVNVSKMNMSNGTINNVSGITMLSNGVIKFTRAKPIYVHNNNLSLLPVMQFFMNVTYDSDMQSNFNDLRVWNTATEQYALSCKEVYISNGYAWFWFNAINVSANSWDNTTYELRYGNATVSDGSTCSNVFDFYTTYLVGASNSSVPAVGTNYAVRGYISQLANNQQWGFSTATGNPRMIIISNTANTPDIAYYSGTTGYLAIGESLNISFTPRVFDIIRNGTTNVIARINNTRETTYTVESGNNIKLETLGSYTHYYSAIRRWVYPEPEIIMGSEYTITSGALRWCLTVNDDGSLSTMHGTCV